MGCGRPAGLSSVAQDAETISQPWRDRFSRVLSILLCSLNNHAWDKKGIGLRGKACISRPHALDLFDLNMPNLDMQPQFVAY